MSLSKNFKKLASAAIVLAGFVTLPAVAASGNAANGEKLTAVCAGCHGADGNSPAPTFPKLAGLGEKYLYKQLVDIKDKTRDIVEMTGLLDNSSDQDLMDMAAYYDQKTLQLAGAKELLVTVNSGVEVDGLAMGEKVYRAGNLETKVPACTGCHSPSGMGNEPSAVPRLSGQYAEYIEKQLREFRAGKRVNDGGDAMIMRKVAEHMSDAEILAVSQFIAGLN